jgi:peptidoglycan/LPS O-acetylase OafA/YrhL
LLNFRKDINGLRAIAVLAVIFCHANISPLFAGGFIGVDIFFVISGFLITSIINNRINGVTKPFSYADFYAKRAKRLLPALYFTTTIALIIGYFIFLPIDFTITSVNLVSVLFFLKNVMLSISTQTYFDVSVIPRLYLHLWSLSVEEQFYLLWPVIFVFVARRKINKVFVIACLIIISLWFSQALISNYSNLSYYLVISRFFEFLIGAIIPFIVMSRNKWVNEVISFTGIVLLVLSFMLINEATEFPGYWALLPTLGTAFIIYGGSHNETRVSSLLNNRYLSFTGSISYSLYLWHWPVFTFLVYLQYSMTIILLVISLGLMYLLSYLTHKYIEEPFKGVKATNKQVLNYYVAVPVAVIISITGYLANQSFSETNKDEFSMLNEQNKPCHTVYPNNTLVINDNCILGDKTRLNSVLWGDSHAAYLSAFLDEVTKDDGNGDNVLHLSQQTCPPIVDAYLTSAVGREPNKANLCVQRNDQVLDFIRKSPNIKNVYLAAFWPLYLNSVDLSVTNPKYILLADDINSPAQSFKKSQALFEKRLLATIEQLISLGKTPILIQNAPEHYKNNARCNIINEHMLSNKSDCTVSASTTTQRNKKTIALFQRVKNKFNTVKFMPISNLVCDKQSCFSEIEGQTLYFDDDHLSAAGAAYLGNKYKVKHLGTLFQDTL